MASVEGVRGKVEGGELLKLKGKEVFHSPPKPAMPVMGEAGEGRVRCVPSTFRLTVPEAVCLSWGNEL